MTKYRVKEGMHVIGGPILKKDDTFELANPNFVTAENSQLFEKVETIPEKAGQVASTASTAAPAIPATEAPKKPRGGRKARVVEQPAAAPSQPPVADPAVADPAV